MVVRTVKGTKKDVTLEDEEIETEGVSKKEKGSFKEYPKAFKKIASMSGTTRIMKCKGGCGGFDDIINIYVDEKGMVTPSKIVLLNTTGKKDVLPENVERQDLTFWGGTPRAVSAEYRKKKASKPARQRKVSKRVSKHKK